MPRDQVYINSKDDHDLIEHQNICIRHDMCNFFIAYCTFFISRSAKAYLGQCRTSMMDYFATKFIVVDVWHVTVHS